MAPVQLLFKGKAAIIRPLAYVEKAMINTFARAEKIPHSSCSCPYSIPSPRLELNKLISALEKACPEIKTNIFKSVQRIKHDYLL
jgi:tRNA 2-thiocytidine biosynthesis protein TtcA